MAKQEEIVEKLKTDPGCAVVLMPNAYEEGPSEIVKCLNCGRNIKLWYNGGELDEEDCCGYRYYGRHTGTEIMVKVLNKG
ncbi:MAG: hypothetical protein E3J66_07240 [Dehalococcoidia bacterium]|nr:MAG: hypothetical protein E3J66_07240 [Dehalococcoidia bacterium]